MTQQLINESAQRLKKIKKNKSNKYIELTKDFLVDPNFLVFAYLQIIGKLGNMTTAVDDETFDGIDKTWFINCASKIKDNSYKFKPARMVNIPKETSSELRSLTIGSPRDKIVQKAIQLIINQIYEFEDKVFLNVSHGFRTNFSCHTAIKQMKTTWTGLY
jgi:RNA-directed DNA polymerase